MSLGGTAGPIRGELFGDERLAAHMRALASAHTTARAPEVPSRFFRRHRGRELLIEHLETAEREVEQARDVLMQASAAGRELSPAGAWLLDNVFVVLEQAQEIRAALPEGYYAELPKLVTGAYTGYPRVYEIAIELIAHTDGRLDARTLDLVLREYQQVAEISMGELWAMPAMLRLGFLENVRRVTGRTIAEITETTEADKWVARFADGAAGGQAGLADALLQLVSAPPKLSPAFITRFIQHLRVRRADFTPLLWLEQWIAEDAMSVEEAVQRSTQDRAIAQLVISNSIISLRTVEDLDWPTIFEKQCASEAVLRQDPAGIYATMTFETRDRYRHVVEKLAKGTRRPEPEVAAAAIALAARAMEDAASRLPSPGSRLREAHVGYYLVGDGFAVLAAQLKYTGWLRERVTNAMLRNPTLTYFGALGAAAIAALAVTLAIVGGATTSDNALAALALLAFLPVADVAVAIVHQIVVLVFPPTHLPRLDFSAGVPRTGRTLVVVPVLLPSVDSVKEALAHLETQYLANRDQCIRFALLSDVLDAKAEVLPSDAAIIAAAVDGVTALNVAYAAPATDDALTGGPFYLLHRPRRWNAADDIWMGWERKRGKLAELNDYLCGVDRGAFNITVGDNDWLYGVRYVITLDADTVLPRGSAAELIGTMAHPLNSPFFDADRGIVTRGYGILQPRVSISLQSANATRFAAIYAGHVGVDPYTTAVSDVYQDLFREGTFTGKGIYDVAVFRRATSGRFPENAVLSHDLIEGAFARAGLVTDVEVFDDYPSTYDTTLRRAHRWTRGDWQLLPWLRSQVPGREGQTDNPLSAISRWKITDNLRRSIGPIAVIAWIIGAWLIPGVHPVRATVAALIALVAPWLIAPIVAAGRPPRGKAWQPYYAAVGRDAAASATQALLAILLLPYQAGMSADAIVRTLARLGGSRRRLLEWQTAAQVERVSRERPATTRLIRPGIAIAAIAAIIALVHIGSDFSQAMRTGWVPLAILTLGWLVAPRVAAALGVPRRRVDLSLRGHERTTAERYAVDHWGYFERFANAESHWLIPDNFQETPAPVVALRTSPTNIGLQLLATMSAHDLGFISADEMLDRLERALNTMDELRRYRGHFFNWYDLGDLRVLDPPYISTVDSGNLAGHLIALAQGCIAVAEIAARDPAAGARRDRLNVIAARARTMAMAMDFRILYDHKRKLFAIGFDERAAKIDASSYDLLASEARLASFVAIAKGDAPADHWFRLGRSLTTKEHATALVSWSGSMFEYLMPTLVLPSRPNSLLEQTCRAAVARQIAYARATEVPWGISESAYNRRDQHATYQYRAFGVPDLALKRGLHEDLVVAPYASLLALAVDPHRALENLDRLERHDALGMYGFYDSIDYTRPEPGEAFSVVRAFMAHHIGMSLVALDNSLNLTGGEGIWQQRFMADPAMRGAALLLDERVPRLYVPQPPQTAGPPRPERRHASTRVDIRRVATANTPEPLVGLLGGHGYRVLLTNAGGGHSSCGDRAVSRWRADATRDDTGHWIYVKDVTADRTWSVAHQPTRAIADEYGVSFAPDRVTFKRRDGEVETSTDIVVIPRERMEVRRVRLRNVSRVAKEIELTSYIEVVLGDADADRAHPAFQNLFVETEWLPDCAAVLASRRPRSAGASRVWCGHVVATSAQRSGAITCETDRARFIGRGRTTHAPRALDRGANLSDTAGAVLDPIMSLRIRVRLDPMQSATVTFSTMVADSREEALRAADKYRDPGNAVRALRLAATEAHLELRDLVISTTEAALYQELAGALIYPRDSLRAPERERSEGRGAQRSLWAHGVSGDRPIVLATIADSVGLPSVRQLLVAHNYWRMKGVACDLIILNTNAPSYTQELHEQLIALVVASSEGSMIDRPGGVFVRRPDAIPPNDVALLRSLARIHIECDGIGLGEIVESANRRRRPAVPLTVQASTPSTPSKRTPRPSEGENGFGRVSPEGDYIIDVSGTHIPPAPWSNVVANANAGFCVTERGGGNTWAENSYLFRLTPWSNDPVSDPCGDVLYLRDESSGVVWTPTPGPSLAIDSAAAPPYTARHGTGQSVFVHERHGISSELTLAVPADDPVKISRLRLTNTGSAARRLTLTSYVEWVLGSQREHTRHHLHSERDDETGALFATNSFHDDFGDRVAFSWMSAPVSSLTSDRDEFIGRNGDLSAPAAMSVGALSQRTGFGLDPCAALRAPIDLAAGETREIIVLLGATRGADAARAVIARNGSGKPIEATLDAWRKRTSTITVTTPSPELDVMVNSWWLYQALSCRMWGRSAFYQSSGAFGFRDQLQDGMAFVYAEPGVARAHLLRSAARQFREGDVQHWWHEPGGRGVRTRFSDDLAWMPFVAAHYVSVTGDTGVWDERATFLDMRQLGDGEHEVYDTPSVTEETATLFEHCRRALDRACTTGAHGLPLFGTGDWNDGMNHVGAEGRGESVWMAWFLISTLRQFAEHAAARGEADMAAGMRKQADAYAAAVDETSWDGNWYRRAYFDDGTPLGSAQSEECRIDSIAQTWSVLSGGADPERAQRAMDSLDEFLVDENARLIKLLTPPFDKSTHNPGYIMGYVPGVRENGAQYTHAACWTVMAAAKLGDGTRAFHYLDILNPLTHARGAADVGRYMVEPYVACADVYAGAGHVGRGGWTWYTGSASLSYRAAVESVLGFIKRGDRLTIDPCVPPEWTEFRIDYRYGETPYRIQVENPDGVSRGVVSVDIDGVPSEDGSIPLTDDGRKRLVVVRMSAAPAGVGLAAGTDAFEAQK